MDKIDRKILSLLQENARYPLKYLAQKVFLSSPAVSTRIERMEKAGIITGYHATIDPVALGYHITAVFACNDMMALGVYVQSRKMNFILMSRTALMFWNVTVLLVHILLC